MITDTVPITDYVYTLNGDTISTEAAARVTYDRPGTYELCITGSNPCSQATPTCYTITVDPPTVTDTTLSLCPGECYDAPDTTLCTPGTYTLQLTSRNGCDSTVNLTLMDQLPDETDLEATICSGDTLRYLDRRYFSPGTYPMVFTNRFGCDSTVNLEIVVTACALNGTIDSENVGCFDGTDGSIRFELTSGAPPYRYDFRRLGGGPAGSGTVALRNESTSLTGLPAGTYLIEVTDDFGSAGYFNTTIDRPTPVVVELFAFSYNGSDLSCTGSDDGSLTATASGGTGAFTYRWSTAGGDGSTLDDLAAGSYSVTATDVNGCTGQQSITLTAPTPVTQRVVATNENCEEAGSGSIITSAGTGGTGILRNQVFDVSTGQQVSASDLDRLPAATYRVLTTDVNDCTVDTTVTIASPQRASATISPVNPTVELGSSLTLTAPRDPGTTYTWSTSDSIVCRDCPELPLLPVDNRYYFLTATSADGCTDRDTALVTVVRTRSVYIPTAFSPNGDGINDQLTVYPGKAVATVLEFSVFDRWGSLFYQEKDLPTTGQELPGWDGTLNGQRAPTGVYAWFARVRYLDGVVKTERGSSVLIR